MNVACHFTETTLKKKKWFSNLHSRQRGLDALAGSPWTAWAPWDAGRGSVLLLRWLALQELRGVQHAVPVCIQLPPASRASLAPVVHRMLQRSHAFSPQASVLLCPAAQPLHASCGLYLLHSEIWQGPEALPVSATLWLGAMPGPDPALGWHVPPNHSRCQECLISCGLTLVCAFCLSLFILLFSYINVWEIRICHNFNQLMEYWNECKNIKNTTVMVWLVSHWLSNGVLRYRERRAKTWQKKKKTGKKSDLKSVYGAKTG